MKSQPQFLNDLKARLWSRFFLLSVFATMYLNDVQRYHFYESLGLDAREYDKHVIKQTNATAGRVFPVVLDVEHPDFYQRLEKCVANNEKLSAIASSNAPAPVKLLRKLPHYVSNGVELIKMYFIKPIRVDQLADTVR